MSLNVAEILVIDPHPIHREGTVAVFSSALDHARIEGSASFSEALVRLLKRPVDLVVSPFRAQDDTVLSFLQDLKSLNSGTRCLILSSLDEIEVGFPCLRAGASGFVRKSAPVSIVVDAVRLILSGNLYISEPLSKALLAGHRSTDATLSPGTMLTCCELRVFTMIGECMPVSTIARKLGISVKTVESHREHIKNKRFFVVNA